MELQIVGDQLRRRIQLEEQQTAEREQQIVELQNANEESRTRQEKLRGSMQKVEAAISALEEVGPLDVETPKKKPGRGSTKRNGKRAPKLNGIVPAMLDKAGTVGLLVEDIVAQIKEQGHSVNELSVRSFLKKMVDTGNAERVDKKRWRKVEKQPTPVSPEARASA